jgi:Mrp family chromosome partitioning ATPase
MMQGRRPTTLDPNATPGLVSAPGLDVSALMPLAVGLATGVLSQQPVAALLSSLRHEGTSTVAASLARTLETGLGRSVALVEANFANPSLAARYGVPATPGLAEVLRGEVPLRRALRVAVSGNLAVLPAGGATAAEQGGLFAAGGLGALCQQIRREGFEFCLLDCPAVLPFPEAAMAAAQAGSTLLVMRAEATRWETIREAIAILEAGGAGPVGTVMNRYRRHLPAFLDRLL